MPDGSRQRIGNFGSFLLAVRKARGLSLGQVIHRFRSLKPPLQISTSTLSRYEHGEILDPSVRFLRACAEVYQISFERIVLSLVSDKYQVNLSSEVVPAQAGEVQSVYYTALGQLDVLSRRLNTDGVLILVSVARSLAHDPRFLIPAAKAKQAPPQ